MHGMTECLTKPILPRDFVVKPAQAGQQDSTSEFFNTVSVPADTFERVHRVLHGEEVEAAIYLSSQHGVVGCVALLDLNRTVDSFNDLISRSLMHYSVSLEQFGRNLVGSTACVMSNTVTQVSSGATQLVSSGVQCAWEMSTWPARKTLALLLWPFITPVRSQPGGV